MLDRVVMVVTHQHLVPVYLYKEMVVAAVVLYGLTLETEVVVVVDGLPMEMVVVMVEVEIKDNLAELQLVWLNHILETYTNGMDIVVVLVVVDTLKQVREVMETGRAILLEVVEVELELLHFL